MFMMEKRQRRWNCSRSLICFLYSTHVLTPHRRVLITTALYTRILVGKRRETTKCATSFWHPVLYIFCWCYILRDDASEVRELLYWYHFKWMSINVDIGSYVRRPLFRLMEYFYLLQADNTWRGSSVWARRVRSSENSRSRMTTSKVFVRARSRRRLKMLPSVVKFI